jgi:hypothetical protein
MTILIPILILIAVIAGALSPAWVWVALGVAFWWLILLVAILLVSLVVVVLVR